MISIFSDELGIERKNACPPVVIDRIRSSGLTSRSGVDQHLGRCQLSINLQCKPELTCQHGPPRSGTHMGIRRRCVRDLVAESRGEDCPRYQYHWSRNQWWRFRGNRTRMVLLSHVQVRNSVTSILIANHLHVHIMQSKRENIVGLSGQEWACLTCLASGVGKPLQSLALRISVARA